MAPTMQKGTKSKRDPGGQAVTAQGEPQEEATGAGGGGGGIRAGQRCRPTRVGLRIRAGGGAAAEGAGGGGAEGGGGGGGGGRRQ